MTTCLGMLGCMDLGACILCVEVPVVQLDKGEISTSCGCCCVTCLFVL